MAVMSEGPRKSKYDTNPLPPIEEVLGVDPEGPTRPIEAAPGPEFQGAGTDPYVARATGWPNGGPEPYATTPGTASHGYMPPQFVVPPQPPAPLGSAFGPRPPQSSSLVAQVGLTQNFAAMVCYLPFVGIVPSLLVVLTEPRENTFMRFHSKQATFAHVAFWALACAFNIARSAAPFPINVALAVPEFIFNAATIAGLVYLMVKAYRWKMVRIPIIGDQVE